MSCAIAQRYGSEEAFCELYSELQGELIALMINVVAARAGEGWRDQLRAVALTMLDYLQEDPARARVMTVDVEYAGERARLMRDRGMEFLYEFIDLGRQEMPDPASLTRVTAEAIAGAIFTRIRIAVEDGDPGGLAPLLPQLMYSAVFPYLGREAAEEELRR